LAAAAGAAFAFFLARWHEPGLATPTQAATAEAAPTAHVAAVGNALFTEFALPFEVVSLVLLVAIVGAVVVARRKTES
jgi:NADH-quinone oxidoreductase subunit J